jgi:hypothetical protein
MEQLNLKTLDEVNIFLSMQEKRISDLEEINHDLFEKLEEEYDTHNEIIDIVDNAIPNSSILSDSFLARAFAIWGHFFIAQLIIGLVIGAFYLIIILLILGGIKTNF